MPEKKTKVSSWQTYKRLLTVYVRPLWWVALIAIVSNAVVSALDAQLVYALGPLIDKGFGGAKLAGDVGPDIEWLKRVPFYVIGFVIVRALAMFISEYTMSWTGRMVTLRMRQDLFEHYLRMPTSYYDSHNAGSISSTITFNTERVALVTTEVIKEIMREGATVLFLFIGMFIANWRLALLFLTAGPLIAVVLRIAAKRFRKIARGLQDTMGGVTHVTGEAIQGFRVVRAFGGQEYESKRFFHVADQSRRQHLKFITTKASSIGLTQIIAGLALALVFAVAIHQMSNGRGTPGEFVAVAGSMLAMLKPIRSMSSLSSQMQQGLAAAQSIFEVMDHPTESDRGTRSLRRAHGELQLEQVSFTYASANEPALREVSFAIAQSKTVALVGRSGSGKSTIASLLMRLYDLDSGRIMLDGVDINEFKLDDYRAQIAVVSQHVTLFNDTIANNIAYGALQSASAQEIERAARLAQAWDFIQEAPQGLQTMIGDNGLMLSGGQRQRLAIARAILKDAPILILDEATSALDNQSERLIQSALENLMKDRTTVVIAHRLSTIENADQIIVIDAGRVVEQGTHTELLARNGEYARLHAAQFTEAT